MSLFNNNKLQHLIVESDKTQRQISDEIGISERTFSNWANGKAKPSLQKIKIIANYFNINPKEFIDEDKRMKSNKVFNMMKDRNE